MTFRTTYHSHRADIPQRVGDRFVRTVKPGVEYAWCVRDAVDHRYDVQQGFCEASDVPENIRKAADARYGSTPSYVEWSK